VAQETVRNAVQGISHGDGRVACSDHHVIKVEVFSTPTSALHVAVRRLTVRTRLSRKTLLRVDSRLAIEMRYPRRLKN